MLQDLKTALSGIQQVPDCCFGVYFLINDGRVIYVGQSRNVPIRVRGHKADKEFQSAFYVPINRPELINIAEAQCIRRFNPSQQSPIPLCRHCHAQIPDGKVDVLGFCCKECDQEYNPSLKPEAINHCRYCGLMLNKNWKRFCKPMCRKRYWTELNKG